MRSVPLSTATDAARFGGKAADLSRALAHGLPVPTGFALDANLVEDLARGEAEDELRALAAVLPSRLAVRSSGIGEDSSRASFAGQHRTSLNVVSAELRGAVSRVWESAHSSAALAYRARLGLPTSSIRMAVVLQPMLAADVAGVLFTRHPGTGADERVVEAAWGLGEAVVSGLVTPDLFRLARDGAVLETRLGVKDLLVCCAETSGTEQRETSELDARRACLSERQLRELAELTRLCETIFEGPRDLEWAYVGSRLFLLQCRAVTQ